MISSTSPTCHRLHHTCFPTEAPEVPRFASFSSSRSKQKIHSIKFAVEESLRKSCRREQQTHVRQCIFVQDRSAKDPVGSFVDASLISIFPNLVLPSHCYFKQIPRTTISCLAKPFPWDKPERYTLALLQGYSSYGNYFTTSRTSDRLSLTLLGPCQTSKKLRRTREERWHLHTSPPRSPSSAAFGYTPVSRATVRCKPFANHFLPFQTHGRPPDEKVRKARLDFQTVTSVSQFLQLQTTRGI